MAGPATPRVVGVGSGYAAVDSFPKASDIKLPDTDDSFQMLRREAQSAGYPVFVSQPPASPIPRDEHQESRLRPESSSTPRLLTGLGNNTKGKPSQHTPRHVRDKSQWTSQRPESQPTQEKISRDVACGSCGVTESPAWRRDWSRPAGVLCNVCSLILTKRHFRRMP